MARDSHVIFPRMPRQCEASFAAEAAVDRTRPLNHQNYARSEGDTRSLFQIRPTTKSAQLILLRRRQMRRRRATQQYW